MTAADLGEFPLIDRLATILGVPSDPRCIIGIGDDAAAWAPTPDTITVATADALVQGVHFDLATTSWLDLGWKAMAENVSDIAAMGCTPKYALITLGLPPDQAVAGVEELYRGIAACASTYGFALVGGDVVRAPTVTLSVTLIGESLPRSRAEPPLLRRTTARAGDIIAVTGPLGGSAAGLEILLDRTRTASEGTDVWTRSDKSPPSTGAGDPPTSNTSPLDDRQTLVQTHLRPVPRVAAGRALVEAGIRCAIDISDGLLADLGHICEQSQIDAEVDVEHVPLFDAATRLVGAHRARQLALSGGEDYELICVAPVETMALANQLLANRGEPPLHVIGRIVPRSGHHPEVRVLDVTGRPFPVGQRGYQHFTV